MSRLLPESRIRRSRARQKNPAFRAAFEALRTSTDAAIAEEIAPPDRPGGFYHDYFCPDHAVQLRFDASTPHEHMCPIDGRRFQGEPFDSAWRWFVNNRLSQSVFELGLRHRIEDHPASLTAARRILLGYAERYASFPAGDDAGYGRGRATFQSLDEAVWLLPLAKGFDLIRDALTSEEQSRIESDLLSPAAAHILSQKYDRIHNIECWHNAALAAVGICTEDAALVERAIEAPFGYRHQLAEGVRDDGLWWEGSASYHFYALYALMSLAQVAEDGDPDLCGSDRLRRMFEVPLQMADPLGLLPAYNDCWYFSSPDGDVCHGVPPAGAFYEVALGWYGDPVLGEPIGRSSAGRSRPHLESLLYGAETLPEAIGSPPSGRSTSGGRPSVILPNSGIALMRTRDRAGWPLEMTLKFGPHGGGHGHPDKLAVTLFARGEAVSPDLGTPGYGIDLHQSWYRRTLSHNTFVVDGQSQPEGEGELLHWEADGRSGRVAARISFGSSGAGASAYDGVAAVREIYWTEGCVVDVIDVICNDVRQIDWVFRIRGEDPKLTGVWPLEEGRLHGEGYEHIRNGLWWSAEDACRIDWSFAKGGMTLAMPSEADTTLIIGAAPFSPASEQTDILIRRRMADEVRYITVFYPWAEPDSEMSVQLDDDHLNVTGRSMAHRFALTSPV